MHKPPAGVDVRTLRGDRHGFNKRRRYFLQSRKFSCIDEACPTHGVAINPGRQDISKFPYQLQWHPTYNRESSCLVLRLPSRRDVAAEPEDAVPRYPDYLCSRSPTLIVRTTNLVGRSGFSFY